VHAGVWSQESFLFISKKRSCQQKKKKQNDNWLHVDEKAKLTVKRDSEFRPVQLPVARARYLTHSSAVLFVCLCLFHIIR